MKRALVYGATGLTGSLVWRELAQHPDLTVTAASRSGNAQVLAVPLSDDARLLTLCREADIIINCAGPFRDTSPVFVALALAAGKSLVQLTCEPPVVTDGFSMSPRFAQQEIALVPSAGFSTALAETAFWLLSRSAPAARDVRVAFAHEPALPSEGTLSSYLAMAPAPRGAERREAIEFLPPFGKCDATEVDLPECAMLERAFALPRVSGWQAVIDPTSRVSQDAAFASDREKLSEFLALRLAAGRHERVATQFALHLSTGAQYVDFGGMDPYALTALFCAFAVEKLLSTSLRGTLSFAALGDQQTLLARLAQRGVRWRRG